MPSIALLGGTYTPGPFGLDRSQQAAVLAGALAVGSYLLGSIPTAFLLARRRLREGLRRLDDPTTVETASLRGVFAGTAWTTSDAVEAAVVVADIAKVLVAATIAWHLTRAVAPPIISNYAQSSFGFSGNQVLNNWQSAGQWCGLIAVVAHFAPPWLGFRGRGQGIAPALALGLIYDPIGFIAAAIAFFGVLAITGRRAVAAAGGMVAAVALAWWLWIFDGPRLWGSINGPEVGLWVVALCAALAARLLANRPA